MFESIMPYLLPILLGFGFHWVAGKCRGRNARNAFRYASWGAWLLLLGFLPIGIVPPLPVLDLINILLRLTPSAICFFLAVSSLLKEVRAQKQGEYTDAM